MKGLLKKEWYIMAKQMRFWIVLVLVYSALSVTGVWGSGMMSAMVCVILFTAPMSLFTQDRMSHWDAFAAALPNGRRAAVKARYFFSLALALFCIVLVMACSALLYLSLVWRKTPTGRNCWSPAVSPSFCRSSLFPF